MTASGAITAGTVQDPGLIGDVLEAYERLILDAMRGDHTLFTAADDIERLWEASIILLESPPPVRMYPPGSWCPKSVHRLIAPYAWRLPFERAWRAPNPMGGGTSPERDRVCYEDASSREFHAIGGVKSG